MNELYSLDIKEQITTPSDRIYLLVHPFWDSTSNNVLYQQNVRQLIKSAEESIITLDEQEMLLTKNQQDGKTIKTFKSLNPKGHRYFTATNGDGGSVPLVGWDGLCNILNNFHPKEIIMGGAQLNGNDESFYFECLGCAYEQLRGRSLPVKLNLDISFRTGDKSFIETYPPFWPSKM